MTVRAALACALALATAGCGSSSASPTAPTIAPARTFELAGFAPAGDARAGVPTTLTFRIDQPDGSPLVHYRTGPGPHTGVHVIVVRDDLSAIVHRHPPIGAGGRVEEAVVFPSPGRYRVLVDAYPSQLGPVRNFQLHRDVTVAGVYRPTSIPPFAATVTVDGYRITLHGRPHLRAIQAAFMPATVTDPHGRPAHFTPWYGALAHAIFFRAGSLDYFHTHVCGAATPGCTSQIGAGSAVVGSSAAPGVLHVGVLLPLGGTWRLFLQCKVDGHVLTAPFTLRVAE